MCQILPDLSKISILGVKYFLTPTLQKIKVSYKNFFFVLAKTNPFCK